MVSFDVESLSTNVPIDAAVEAALPKLENDPSLADRSTDRGPSFVINKRRAAKKQTVERTTNRNKEDRNTLITAVENQPITAEHNALQGFA